MRYREAFFRLLQVGVVAPYLFKLSKSETGYYSAGLKLTAATLIAMNVRPLIADYDMLAKDAKKLGEEFAKARQQLEQQNRRGMVIDAANVEDGAYTES